MLRRVALAALLLSSAFLVGHPAIAAKQRSWMPIPNTGKSECVDRNSIRRAGKWLYYDEGFCGFENDPDPNSERVDCAQFRSQSTYYDYHSGRWVPQHARPGTFGSAVVETMCSKRF